MNFVKMANKKEKYLHKNTTEYKQKNKNKNKIK